VAELRARLDQNSRNSSMPPSSDGYPKEAVNKDRSLRRRSERRPGGRHGQQGHHLERREDPEPSASEPERLLLDQIAAGEPAETAVMSSTTSGSNACALNCGGKCDTSRGGAPSENLPVDLVSGSCTVRMRLGGCTPNSTRLQPDLGSSLWQPFRFGISELGEVVAVRLAERSFAPSVLLGGPAWGRPVGGALDRDRRRRPGPRLRASPDRRQEEGLRPGGASFARGHCQCPHCCQGADAARGPGRAELARVCAWRTRSERRGRRPPALI
jgi:hypothetical protein